MALERDSLLWFAAHIFLDLPVSVRPCFQAFETRSNVDHHNNVADFKYLPAAVSVFTLHWNSLGFCSADQGFPRLEADPVRRLPANMSDRAPSVFVHVNDLDRQS